MKTQATGLAVLVLALAALSVVAVTLPVSVAGYGVIAALAVWGVAGWSFYPAQSARLVKIAPAAPVVALSLNSSSSFSDKRRAPGSRRSPSAPWPRSNSASSARRAPSPRSPCSAGRRGRDTGGRRAGGVTTAGRPPPDVSERSFPFARISCSIARYQPRFRGASAMPPINEWWTCSSSMSGIGSPWSLSLRWELFVADPSANHPMGAAVRLLPEKPSSDAHGGRKGNEPRWGARRERRMAHPADPSARRLWNPDGGSQGSRHRQP